jgi:hypothetical protein
MEAVTNWRACIHEPGSGPLTGHYARRVPVIQSLLQAHADGSVRAWRHNGRDLPSWSCEFDSRHPLHGASPRPRLPSSTPIRTRSALYCGRWAAYGPPRDGFVLSPDPIGLAGPMAAYRIGTTSCGRVSSCLSSRPAGQHLSDNRGRLVDRHPSRLQRAERRRMKQTGRHLCEEIIIAASQSACT